MKKYNKNERYNESYNKNYNPRKGVNTSTSLYQLIQKRNLTDCLELLENLGYAEERAIHAISCVQCITGLEVGV